MNKTYRVTFKDTNESRDFDTYAKASNWAQERSSEIAKTEDSFICPFIELLDDEPKNVD